MRLLAASFVALAGCSAVVDDPGDTDGTDVEGAGVRASVSVQRTAAAEDGASEDGDVHTHVAARFLRVTGGLDRDTADRVIGADELDANAPLGCSWRDGSGAVAGDAGGAIELLDVGDITLHAPGSEMALAPRAFPDVGGLVSGVIYTSRDGRSGLPDGATYLFEVSGAGLVDGFSVQVDAPAAPVGLRLGDKTFGDDVVLSSGEPLEFGWEPGSAAGGDRIYVTAEGDGQAFTCVLEDDGGEIIPGSFVAFAPGSHLDMMVHRHRRVGEQTVVDFDFAVAAQLTLAE